MKRKVFRMVSLTALTCFMFSAPTLASDVTQDTEPMAIVEENDEEVVTTYTEGGEAHIYTGEHYASGKWNYYFSNGQKACSQFVDLGVKTVYYNADGEMLYGSQVIDGENYYFNIYTGAMYCGELCSNGKWYYYLADGKRAYSQFVDLGAKTVYYNTDGEMLYGDQVIEGKNYLFETYTGAAYTGERLKNGKWFYYEKGQSVKNRFVDMSNKKVYYGADGGMLYGKQVINDYPYYFDTITGALKLGLAEYDGKTYYYTRDGIQKGERYINGYWYYFDENTACMQTGFVNHHEKKYYYDVNGWMQYGEKVINNKWYYFDPIFGTMATGRTVHHGHTYLYNNEGVMAHGWTVDPSDGNTYYFDPITGILQTGWQKDDDKVFYYENGLKSVGERFISGKWYYFYPEAERMGEMAVGWTEHNGNKYYYNQDGQMQYGWQTVDGIGYYFRGVYGTLVEGFEKQDGHTYFILDKGENKKYIGEKAIDGYWYYFEPEMVTGWKDLGNRRVYYSSEGRMCYGEQYIDGIWYYFDLATGALKDGQSFESASLAQKNIVLAAYATPFYADGYCATWVSQVYARAGQPYPYGNANSFTMSRESQLKVGMVICVQHSGPNYSSWNYGHIGIYLGNGKIMHNESSMTGNQPNGCTITDIDAWKARYEYQCTAYYGWVNGIDLSR